MADENRVTRLKLAQRKARLKAIQRDAQARLGMRDSRTGAPMGVRAAVGAAPPEGRLATIRKTFPGAEPAIGDPDNFEFMDPETGRLTLYNPPGLDVGDLASLGVEAGQFVGGTLGAIGGGALGSAVAPGVGTLAGGMAGAGAGAALGGEAVRTGMELLGLIEDPRTISKRGSDLATEFAFGAAGEGVGMIAGKALRAGTRRFFGGGEDTARVIADFESFGATPTVGAATKRQWVDAMEAFLSRVPGGSGQIRRHARATAAKAQRRAEELSARLSEGMVNRTDEEILGRAIRGDIENTFLPQWRAKKDALYDVPRRMVPPDAPAVPDHTLDVLGELAGVDPRAVRTSRTALARSPTLARLNDALGADLLGRILSGDEPTIPLAVLDRIRKRVGNKLASTDLVVNVDRGELKQLYRALSNDYEQALLAADPSGDAVRAHQRANKFYQAGLQRIDTFLEPLVKKKTAEEAFEAVVAGNGEALRAIRKSVEPEHWRAVAAHVIQRLGEPPAVEQAVSRAGGIMRSPGFDMEAFLRRWNEMSPRAKAALFEGHPKMASLKHDLDRIAGAASRMRENLESFELARAGATTAAGVTLSGAALGFALSGAPGLFMALAISGVTTASAAKLMTSPRFVRWLARATTLEPNGLGAHVGRLGAIAQSEPDPERRDAMMEYLDLLGTEPDDGTQPQ